MGLIPPFFLDCVVVIGKTSKKGVMWSASGFLYGDLIKAQGEQKTYHVFLVTNRHVFRGLREGAVRFNPKGGEPAKEYRLRLKDASGRKIWTSHPDPKVDIAVATANVQLLKNHEMQFSYFRSDEHVATLAKMAELGITEGDFVYALGFPMGLIGGERNYVIVRSGTIARVQDAINQKSKEILVDTLIYPGNSGGPVIAKPETMAIKGTKALHAAYLIGVVVAFVPYQDVAISTQTGLPRVVFQENSGLAAVVPVDFDQETVQEHLKRFGEGVQ